MLEMLAAMFTLGNTVFAILFGIGMTCLFWNKITKE